MLHQFMSDIIHYFCTDFIDIKSIFLQILIVHETVDCTEVTSGLDRV